MSYGNAATTEYASDAKGPPITAPDTFPGLVARLESIVKRSRGLRGHAEDIREKIDGSRVPNGDKGASQLTAVKSGFISQAEDLLAELDQQLRASDEALEYVWAKVS